MTRDDGSVTKSIMSLRFLIPAEMLLESFEIPMALASRVVKEVHT